jgi:hypothetical protein
VVHAPGATSAHAAALEDVLSHPPRSLSDRYKNALSPCSMTIMDLCAVPGLA